MVSWIESYAEGGGVVPSAQDFRLSGKRKALWPGMFLEGGWWRCFTEQMVHKVRTTFK